jgi:hypothetical protein
VSLRDSWPQDQKMKTHQGMLAVRNHRHDPTGSTLTLHDPKEHILTQNAQLFQMKHHPKIHLES